MSKKITFIVAFVAFIVSAGGSFAYFSSKSSSLQFSKPTTEYQPPNGKSSTPEATDTEPKTEECPLNGAMYSKKQQSKWAVRRPLVVMIENTKDARPQSGLTSTDVLYEAVAEGGISRFMSVFYCQDAPFVGPVRSARIYFIRMTQEYGEYPLYAHVGAANCNQETGSGCGNGAKADALGELSKLGWAGYNNLNQFAVPFPVFYRDYSRLKKADGTDVDTEHTMYTSTQKLWTFAKDKRELTNLDADGKQWDATFKKWKFQDDSASNTKGSVKKINYEFWKSLASDFNVQWDYDSSTNSYKRTTGGKAHLDKNTGKQLDTKNVILMMADESVANDNYDAGQHLLYDIIGTGDAYIFQNGTAVKGSWSKKSPTDRTIYTDDKGKEVAMVRGRVYIAILPTENKITY
ncbi:MAG: DUF3048 domain-containing protein [Candidatus Roizmanbacteria bacterium]